jgi:hypothetical protein
MPEFFGIWAQTGPVFVRKGDQPTLAIPIRELVFRKLCHDRPQHRDEVVGAQFELQPAL